MPDGLFAQKLTEAREAKGLTKYRLAKETGFSEAYIGRLEKGQGTPSPDAIAKLAPVIGVPLAEVQAWADADRLGEERVKAVQAHATQNDETPQTPEEVEARLEFLIEQAMNLPEEKRLKLAAYFFARARQLEAEGKGKIEEDEG